MRRAKRVEQKPGQDRSPTEGARAFAESIKDLRKRLGLSIAKVAAEAQVSPNSWVAAERGDLGPAEPKGGENYSREKKGRIRTAVRIVGYFLEHDSMSSSFGSLPECMEILGFDAGDVDVEAAIQNRPVPRALERLHECPTARRCGGRCGRGRKRLGRRHRKRQFGSEIKRLGGN